MARKDNLEQIVSPAKRIPIQNNFEYLANELDSAEISSDSKLQLHKESTDHSTDKIVNLSNVDGDTATEAINNIKQQYDNHKDGVTDKHNAQDIVYDGSVVGAGEVKQAIDNIQLQVNEITTTPNDGNVEISQARVDINNVVHNSLKTRLDTMEKKHYFWIEEKTINAGSNSFTLTNVIQPYMTLLVRDLKYGLFWENDLHWTVSGQTITLTESALFETLTFRIIAY